MITAFMGWDIIYHVSTRGNHYLSFQIKMNTRMALVTIVRHCYHLYGYRYFYWLDVERAYVRWKGHLGF